MDRNDLTCAVCKSRATVSESVHSAFSNHTFVLAHCPVCHYSFVVDPRTDFESLYDAAYYRGHGADPTVDFETEFEDPRTIRLYEWRGIVSIVQHLRGSPDGIRWLDFGCGLGGFVRYARGRGFDVVGFDEGHAAEELRERGIPALARSELPVRACSFDVVTAIEVLEHLVDPMPTLRLITELLQPGGLLFVTTGNAAPFRGRLDRWSYVHPDVHVGYFEPATLETAFRSAGLDPSYPGFLPGLANLIRYKVLKRLGFKRRGLVERLVPWSLASRVVDGRLRVSAQPVGWRH